MIKAIITDFDGTLVNTFEANLKAYTDAFKSVGLELIPSVYRMAYGLNFANFMKIANVPFELQSQIKLNKANYYKTYFNEIGLNERLVSLIREIKCMGVKTGIATMASRPNVNGILNHFNIVDLFDLVITGEDVEIGKPHPLIYNLAMQKLESTPDDTLIFEDGEDGIESAKQSGAHYIKVKI